MWKVKLGLSTPRRDAVIGCITKYTFAKIKVWAASLQASGFEGRKVVISTNVDQTVLDELIRRGFEVYNLDALDEKTRTKLPVANSKHEISVNRFFYIWHTLKRMGPEGIRYVILTDVRDIVFQKNPSDWLVRNMRGKKLAVSSETVRYKEERWNLATLAQAFGPELRDVMSERILYNAGLIAGEYDAIASLALAIYLVSNRANVDYCDQAGMNILLTLSPFKEMTKFVTSESGWACHGAVVMPDESHPGPLLEPPPVLHQGSIRTHKGEIYTCVHQYDKVPAWKRAIEKQWGGT